MSIYFLVITKTISTLLYINTRKIEPITDHQANSPLQTLRDFKEMLVFS